jgi:ribosomal protein S18 acetylase RimI-like enzyme
MIESDMYTIEPGTESIIYDYAALFNAIDSKDNPDHIRLTGEYFQCSFSAFNVDLERDTIVVRNGNGDLIASGVIILQNYRSLTSRLIIQVLPEYRREGIGSRVLQHLIEIGRTRGSSEFICRFPSYRPYVGSFLRNHGFDYVYSWTKMRIEHKNPVVTPSLPWGITVRGLNIKKELQVWAGIQNAIFRGRPHYEMVDFESLRFHTEHSSFDRNLLILGVLSEKPVGYGTGYSVLPETGEKTLKISGIGVLPEYRRKRYGQALLHELLNRAYIKGHTSSEIVVLSTNRPAIRLYEKCGFRERYKYLWYKRTNEQ